MFVINFWGILTIWTDKLNGLVVYIINVHSEMYHLANMNESEIYFNDTLYNSYPYEVPTLSPIVMAAKHLRRICIPIIVAIGLCGNTLSLMVFSAQSMKKTSCSVFLGSMAGADNLFLLSLLITWFDGEIATIITHDLSCQLLIYFTYVTSFLSVWFIVGFTLERYIAICFPLKRQVMCSVRREKIAVACMTLSAAIMYNYSFWTAGMQEFDSKQECLLHRKHFHFLNIVTWIDSFLTMVIPFFIIIIVNSLVLKTIIQCPLKFISASNRSFRNSTSNPRPKRRKYILSSHHSRKRSLCAGLKEKLFNTRNPQIRVTRTLMLVSMTFLCLNLPSHAMRLYNLFSSVLTDRHFISEEYFLIQEVTLLLYYVTFSCNFVLYTLFGRNFKKSLLLILKCRSPTEDKRRKLLKRICSNNNSHATPV